MISLISLYPLLTVGLAVVLLGRAAHVDADGQNPSSRFIGDSAFA